MGNPSQRKERQQPEFRLLALIALFVFFAFFGFSFFRLDYNPTLPSTAAGRS